MYELDKRGLGLTYDLEAVQREAANGFGSRDSLPVEETSFALDGSDLYFSEEAMKDTQEAPHPGEVQALYADMIDQMDERVKAGVVSAEFSKEETISNEEFDRRVSELYREHPQFVDGVTTWLAIYMDQKYPDIEAFDVVDPDFQQDLKALVETIYVSSKHENEQFDLIDIEYIVVDAIEQIEGIQQKPAREKLSHKEHLYSEEQALTERPLVTA